MEGPDKEQELTCPEKYAYAFARERPRHEPDDDFSLRHPKMPLNQRAKIFAPFAALKGYKEALDAKLRLYEEKRELNEEEQEALNESLLRLRELTRNSRAAKENRTRATVRYYLPCEDENSDAYGRLGSYESVTGTVWRVDPITRLLYIGSMRIEIDDIDSITLLKEDEA